MSDQDQIQSILEAYKTAVRAKDADAFVALFDDDVQVFDMWGQWRYEGAKAWHSMAKEWFGSLGDDQVTVEFSDIEILASETVAAAHATVTFTGFSASGEKLRSMDSRLTWALRKSPDGQWRVLHEHTSAPLDSETLKGILRKP
jgi:uncharacterized protein (TIGR02246 family)